MVGSKRVEIYYTPFDRMTTTGKIVLVGITPGMQQHRLALQAARAALASGCSHDEAVLRAKSTGGFAGAIRVNATKMLDDIGIADLLGIDSAAGVFGEGQHKSLAVVTSAYCHAVFVDGRDYSGGGPIARLPILRDFATRVLGAQLAAAQDALVIPFGDAASDAVTLAVASGALSGDRVLFGFPHPSGANGHRKRKFEQERERLRASVSAWSSRS